VGKAESARDEEEPSTLVVGRRSGKREELKRIVAAARANEFTVLEANSGWGGRREGAGRVAEAGEVRSVVLRVRLTPDEHARLVELAGGRGEVSEWVRKRLLK
jgi:hypothetical protein